MRLPSILLSNDFTRFAALLALFQVDIVSQNTSFSFLGVEGLAQAHAHEKCYI